MVRSLVVPLLAVVALVLGGTAAERIWEARSEPAPEPRQESGVLELTGAPVHFTLFWPAEDSADRLPLVIFAADARAEHPRPLRSWARAAAANGVVTAYLEPSNAPEEAAARLQAVLEHHGETLGIDSGALWTWVEGAGLQRLGDSPGAPCGRRNTLALVVASAERRFATAGRFVQQAVDATLSRARCRLAGMP